jgi:hypothetical protein
LYLNSKGILLGTDYCCPQDQKGDFFPEGRLTVSLKQFLTVPRSRNKPRLPVMSCSPFPENHRLVENDNREADLVKQKTHVVL